MGWTDGVGRRLPWRRVDLLRDSPPRPRGGFRRPHELWVADVVTAVTVTGGFGLAVVVDAWSHAVVGWGTGPRLERVLADGALSMAVRHRNELVAPLRPDLAPRASASALTGNLRPERPTQKACSEQGFRVSERRAKVGGQGTSWWYTSLRATTRAFDHGAEPTGAGLAGPGDDEVAELVVNLWRCEVLHTGSPWRTADDLELATAEWVDFFNQRRPFGTGAAPARREAEWFAARRSTLPAPVVRSPEPAS